MLFLSTLISSFNSFYSNIIFLLPSLAGETVFSCLGVEIYLGFAKKPSSYSSLKSGFAFWLFWLLFRDKMSAFGLFANSYPLLLFWLCDSGFYVGFSVGF